MIKEYHKGCDIVYGVRAARKTDTFFKRATAEGFYKVMNFMGAEVVFNHADYRLLSKRVLEEFANFKEVNIFLRGMVPLVGFKSTSVYYDRAERMADMQRSIRLTALVGCRYWVIHPIMPFGAHAEPDTEEFWRLNEEFFRALLPTAKENNVVICLENMPMKALSLSTPDKVLEFVRKINDDNFKFCLDTGHAHLRGFSPAKAVRMAGDDLKVLHVHDNDQSSDQHLPVFYGDTDWRDFRRALEEIGFDGVFSLELGLGYHVPDRAFDLLMQSTCVALEELLDQKILRF